MEGERAEDERADGGCHGESQATFSGFASGSSPFVGGFLAALGERASLLQKLDRLRGDAKLSGDLGSRESLLQKSKRLCVIELPDVRALSVTASDLGPLKPGSLDRVGPLLER